MKFLEYPKIETFYDDDVFLVSGKNGTKTVPFNVFRVIDNLLDNAYFVGGGSQLGDGRFPINQRGQTSYNGTGYGIDRWFSDSSTANIKLLDNGAVFSNGVFQQKCSDNIAKYLINKTVTLSILTQDGLYYATSVVEYDKDVCSIYLPDDVLVRLHFFSNGSKQLVRMSAENASVTIIAAKLELGDCQTLAHKEGDTWVINEIPNYKLELLKCQYYYRPAHLVCIAKARDTNSVELYSAFPTDMRVKPTFTPEGTVEVYAPNGWTQKDMSKVSVIFSANKVMFFVQGVSEQVKDTIGYGVISGAWNAES